MLVYAGVLATVVMMCLTSADALSRYLLNRPILGAYEITEKYLMVASIFLGLSYAYRGGMFIRVTFLVDRLPAGAEARGQYLVIGHAGVLPAGAGCDHPAGAARLAGRHHLSALPIPVGPAYSFVPLGFLALTVMLLIDLPRVRSGQILPVPRRGATPL